MRLFLALLLIASSVFGQSAAAVGPTTTVTITLQFPNPVLWDINASFLGETDGACGTLIAPMLSTDTTLQLNTTSVILPVSSSIEIDIGLAQAEPLSVLSFTPGPNNTATVTVAPRGPSALFALATPAAHAVGATCSILTNQSPAAMITREALLPWAVSKVNTLAIQGKSATLYSAVTGMTVVSQ